MPSVKKYVKKVIRHLSIRGIQVEQIDDRLVLCFHHSYGKLLAFIHKNKKYKIVNNKVEIHCPEGSNSSILSKRNKLVLEFAGKRMTIGLSPKIYEYKGEYSLIGDKKHRRSDNALVILNGILRRGDDIIIGYDDIGLGTDPLVIVMVDQEHNIVSQGKVDECGKVILPKARLLLEDQRMQLIALSKDSSISLGISANCCLDNDISYELNRGILFLKDSLYDNYSFMDKDERLQYKIGKNSQTIKAIANRELNGVEVTRYDEREYYIYWEDILKGTEIAAEINNVDGVNLLDITSLFSDCQTPYERMILKCRHIRNHTDDDEYVTATGEFKSLKENHILAQNDIGRLICIQDGRIIAELNDSYLTYEKRFSYDLKNNTFITDVKAATIDANNVEFDLKLSSLLMPISSLVFFVRDYYKKKAFYLDEIVCNKPIFLFDGHISLNMDAIRRKYYHNMRLSFRVGVRYANGYSEEGFISYIPGNVKAKDRYLVKTNPDEAGMISGLYLGENRFNLNLWYTSDEEYERGVTYSIGREVYDDTIKNEVIDNHLILFEANLGKNYTGNPKYLYEYMKADAKYSAFRYVWTYPESEKAPIPGDAIIVQRGSPEYFYYLAKAKYRINNIRFPIQHKKRGMVYLNTWHGTPLKKLGFDIECEGPEKQAFSSLYQESLNWDYMTVDNDYGEEKLVSAFKFKGHVIKKGYPINDIFYDDQRRSRVEKRLENDYPIIKEKKVILYAPTWRDLKGDYVRGYEFELPFDLDYMFEKIGNDFILLVKLHHLIADNLVIDDKYKDFIINVSVEEDVMELLCKTDILITDYSSIFYDFASAHKPILFYMYDLEEYLNETRGTYVDVNTLPGPIVKDDKALVRFIDDIYNNHFSYNDRLEKFCEEFAKYCKGSSCRDVLDIVIDKEDLQ